MVHQLWIGLYSHDGPDHLRVAIARLVQNVDRPSMSDTYECTVTDAGTETTAAVFHNPDYGAVCAWARRQVGASQLTRRCDSLAPAAN